MKIEDLLRLKFAAGLSNRQFARSCAVSRTTQGNKLQRAEETGIGWPVPEGLSEQKLELKLFPKGRRPWSKVEDPQSDRIEIHRKVRGKGVT